MSTAAGLSFRGTITCTQGAAEAPAGPTAGTTCKQTFHTTDEQQQLQQQPASICSCQGLGHPFKAAADTDGHFQRHLIAKKISAGTSCQGAPDHNILT
jgi:hypothetical protein